MILIQVQSQDEPSHCLEAPNRQNTSCEKGNRGATTEIGPVKDTGNKKDVKP
jgi:hypothetical protein